MTSGGRTTGDVVRELCLALPGSEEVLSHGSPGFRVAGKSFATYTVNHHGDGRVALNIASPPGVQQLLTETGPDGYFIPPYVGPRGWLGIELNKGLDWQEIARLVREAYEHVAPASLLSELPATPVIEPPDIAMAPEDIDPFLRGRARDIVGRTGELCAKLPQTSETVQFGSPVWKAGKKTFAGVHHSDGRLQLHIWVGVERQSLMTEDPRYHIPAYTGHHGWIGLDVEDYVDWKEVRALLLDSYRHFALKRMLRQLGDAT